MNKLANRLAEKLVNNGADLENVEIYAYGAYEKKSVNNLLW